jgi:hypothetical protein
MRVGIRVHARTVDHKRPKGSEYAHIYIYITLQ